MSLKQLRSNISIVMQDVFLFSDTISENVKLGKRNLVDLSTIRGASSCAQASDFIEKLDEQYDTVIGERGVGLSGGQKQRISIARAIAKKNPILVLDDSTSALDMETEYAIQQALLELTDTTKLIIAHRISASAMRMKLLFWKTVPSRRGARMKACSHRRDFIMKHGRHSTAPLAPTATKERRRKKCPSIHLKMMKKQ